MPDIFDQAASSAPSGGDVFDQAASHAGYWQELYQQSGIPGLMKGLKEHPAETVANAIGGLFAPLNPNYTQSEQGKALKENLTRSPESLAAALTLGGLAAAPIAGKLGPAAVSATAEAAGNAAKFTGAAAKTAAPGLISAGAKLAAGHALSGIPGMEWPARLALEYPAIHQGIKTLGKAYQAGKAAINSGEEEAAAAPRPARASAAPAAAPPTPEAPPATAPGKTAADLLNEEMGTKEAAPPPTAKVPGQALAESHGETWSKLSEDDKLSYAQLEGAQASSEARNAAPAKAFTPRPPEYYGVKAAEAPPPQPPPSAPAPAQPASAAPPQAPSAPPAAPMPPSGTRTVVQFPQGGKPGSVTSVPPPEAEDIDFQQRYGEQEQPEVAKFLGHEQAEPPQPKPASKAQTANAQAKADRFVQAIRRFNSDNPQQALTADELSAAGDEERGMLTQGLKQGGYLKNTETYTDTSFPYILQKLRDAETAARQTIKPPKGFSMAEHGIKY